MSYFDEWPFHTVPGSHPEIWANRKELLSKAEPLFEVSKKRPRPSKFIVVWGAFGSGKTHLMKYFEWRIAYKDVGFVVYSPFPKEKIKGFYDLYRSAFVNRMKFLRLGQIACKIWNGLVIDFGQTEAYLKVMEMADEWYDFAKVFSALGMLFSSKFDFNDPMLRLCKTWLCGEKMYAQDKRNLGVGSDIRADHDAIKLFSTLVKVVSSRRGVPIVVFLQ